MEPIKRTDHPVDIKTVTGVDAKKRRVEISASTESEGSPISSERITLTRTELTKIVDEVIFNIIGNRDEALSKFSKSGHLKIVKYLVESGMDPKVHFDDDHPLYCAAENGHADVVRFLLEQGVDPEIKEREGLSPIMIATKNGHADVVEVLLEHTESHEIVQLVQLAIKEKSFTVVSKLVEKGAQVKDGVWELLVKEAVIDGCLKGLESLLRQRPVKVYHLFSHAAQYETTEVMEILLSYGKGIEEEHMNYVRLYDAVKRENVGSVKHLLALGTDINETEFYNVEKNPLILAARHGWIDGLKVMIDYLDFSSISIIKEAYHNAKSNNAYLCALALKPILKEYLNQ